ncbi:MAG: hypothetical protein QOF84_3987 [Streptomyces sp.]|nr:hypothetical protein [Streptomyces sp.]
MSDLKDQSGESVPQPRSQSPSHPAPPNAEIHELVRQYLGPLRRAGRRTLPNGTPGREDLVLAKAGFEAFARHVIPAGQVVERSADDIVAWVFSLSHSAPHLVEDRPADFEQGLRALLREASPDNGFAECLPATEIKTWRKPQGERWRQPRDGLQPVGDRRSDGRRPLSSPGDGSWFSRLRSPAWRRSATTAHRYHRGRTRGPARRDRGAQGHPRRSRSEDRPPRCPPGAQVIEGVRRSPLVPPNRSSNGR